MKAFRVTGTFADKRQGRQPFCVEIAAEDDAAAQEQIVSTFGSRHKLKRWQINIAEITELSAAEVENHIVKYKIGA